MYQHNNKQGMKSHGNLDMSLDNTDKKVTVCEHGKKAAICTSWPAAIPNLNSSFSKYTDCNLWP